MVNGLAVLGWGVGGIEAEAAMLGQPMSMLMPEVIGFKLTGKLKEGVTATDLVLTVTQMLRKKGVVGKFVEFFGPGLDASVARRPRDHRQHGAGIWRDLRLLPDRRRDHRLSQDHRRASRARRAGRGLCQGAGLFRTAKTPDPVFTDTLTLDLGDVVPSLAGPKRRRTASRCRRGAASPALMDQRIQAKQAARRSAHPVEGRRARNFDLGHGDVVIAAITSCTNTSNPSVMIAAGLLARKAVAKGLTVKPWVKTSLAPGSQVVTEYLAKAGLNSLDKLGFNLVGYGCTTCIGNSGPLPPEIPRRSTTAIWSPPRAVGQPQLRRPRQPGRARQLSRLAAAGGGLCAGRLDAST
jgi:aconitate hydratase